MRPAESRGFGRRGMAASEFALVAPLFFIVCLGAADIIRVCRAQLRAETVAVQIGQIVSQCRPITTNGVTNTITAADLTNLWTQAQRIAGGVINVNNADGGAMIISAVARNTNTNPASNTLSWQRRTGDASQASRLNATSAGSAVTISTGNASPLPTRFVVPAGQTLLVTEVYAEVTPWTLSAGLIGTALPRVVYGTTLFLTRAPEPVNLQTAPSTSTTASCTA